MSTHKIVLRRIDPSAVQMVYECDSVPGLDLRLAQSYATAVLINVMQAIPDVAPHETTPVMRLVDAIAGVVNGADTVREISFTEEDMKGLPRIG